NELAGYYLQFLRETGDINYLNLAQKAADSSLAAMPAEQNPDGLGEMARVKFASHDFLGSRDDAQKLTTLSPMKSFPYETLGDALLELGDYDHAAQNYRRIEKSQQTMTVNLETRLARLATLRGDMEGAQDHFTNALVLALD